MKQKVTILALLLCIAVTGMLFSCTKESSSGSGSNDITIVGVWRVTHHGIYSNGRWSEDIWIDEENRSEQMYWDIKDGGIMIWYVGGRPGETVQHAECTWTLSESILTVQPEFMEYPLECPVVKLDRKNLVLDNVSGDRYEFVREK